MTLTERRARTEVMNATPTDFVAELLLCPGRIEEAEKALRQAKMTLEDRKEQLREEEARILLGGCLTGKNKEERDAQVFQLTEEARRAVIYSERYVSEVAVRVNREHNRFSALKAACRFMAREHEE